MSEISYSKQEDRKNTLKLREMIAEMPDYVREFFRGIEPQTSSRTRIAYAYDLGVFFSYLHNNNSVFRKKEITEITLSELEALKPIDIEEYLDYVKLYSSNGASERSNELQAIKRKLASLSAPFTSIFT